MHHNCGSAAGQFAAVTGAQPAGPAGDDSDTALE